MHALQFVVKAKPFFETRFAGFRWQFLMCGGIQKLQPKLHNEDVIHVFDNPETGQRMLVEVNAAGKWAAYTLHESGEGQS